MPSSLADCVAYVGEARAALGLTGNEWLERLCRGLPMRFVRLSRRQVQQVLVDLWDIKLSLGAVLRQERAQSAALAPVVAEVRTAVQQAAVVNVDETGWREAKQRAWLWTAVTPMLTVFLH